MLIHALKHISGYSIKLFLLLITIFTEAFPEHVEYKEIADYH
jgi:hypothetical protein